MLKTLVFSLLILLVTHEACASDKIDGFFDYLPQNYQLDKSTTETHLDLLAESAALHPDLIYHQLQYFIALDQYGPKHKQTKHLLEQYHRQKAIQRQARWDWTISQLNSLDSAFTKPKHQKAIQKVLDEVRRQKPIRFAAPMALTWAQKNEQSFYTCLYLSQAFDQNFDPELDYGTRRKISEAEATQRLHLEYQQFNHDSNDLADDWIEQLFDNWYLFNDAGDSFSTDVKFNIKDVVVDLLTVTKTGAFFDIKVREIDKDLVVQNSFISLGIAVPCFEINVPREFLHASSDSPLFLHGKLPSGVVAAEIGSIIPLRSTRGLFSNLLLRMGFSFRNQKSYDSLSVFEVRELPYNQQHDLIETWTGISSIQDFKSSLISVSGETPLLFLGKHFSIDMGLQILLAFYKYTHDYNVQLQRAFLYPDGHRIGVGTATNPPITEVIKDQSITPLPYLAFKSDLNSRSNLNAIIAHNAIAFHLTYHLLK